MDLPVQSLDARLFAALGITSRGGYRAMLSDRVFFTVPVPLGGGAETSLGFNDSETEGDHAFVRSASVAALAANFSGVQVFNPAGSGKTFFLDLIICAAGVATTFHLRSHTTLATLAGSLFNARLGGPSPTAAMRTDQLAALPGTLLASRVAVANTDVLMAFNPPLMIGQGLGACLFNANSNQDVIVTAFGREYLAA